MKIYKLLLQASPQNVLISMMFVRNSYIFKIFLVFTCIFSIDAGSAIGFRLDSLLKLIDTRARNNKMTLMHYLCKVPLFLEAILTKPARLQFSLRMYFSERMSTFICSVQMLLGTNDA